MQEINNEKKKHVKKGFFYQSKKEFLKIPFQKMQEMIFLYNAIQDGWKVQKNNKIGYILSGKKTKENIKNNDFEKKLKKYVYFQ